MENPCDQQVAEAVSAALDIRETSRNWLNSEDATNILTAIGEGPEKLRASLMLRNDADKTLGTAIETAASDYLVAYAARLRQAAHEMVIAAQRLKDLDEKANQRYRDNNLSDLLAVLTEVCPTWRAYLAAEKRYIALTNERMPG